MFAPARNSQKQPYNLQLCRTNVCWLSHGVLQDVATHKLLIPSNPSYSGHSVDAKSTELIQCQPYLRGNLRQLPDAVVIELAAVESDGAHQVQTRQQTPQPRPLQHLQHQLALK